MIAVVALALALNGADPAQVGPVRIGADPAAVIELLGPIVPFVVCDTTHFSYTDGTSTVTFDGLHEITLTPKPSELTAMPPAGTARRPPAGTPVRPVSPLHAPLAHWTYMGRPVFSKPSRLPGFVVLRPGRGERVHWYHPGAPRIDYYRLADGTVEITSDGSPRD